MKLSKICLVLLIIICANCSIDKSVVISSTVATTPPPYSTSILNKTTIKSQKVELGTRPPGATTTLTINVGNNQLIIQCEELIINQNITFNGSGATVIIEYSKLSNTSYQINHALGTSGTFRMEKKKISF
jgi:hypothetical protein